MAKPPKLPDSLLDLTAPALPEASLSQLAKLSEAAPEEFKAALGSALRKLVIQGFRTLQAPRNWKEQATAIDLLRKMEGWDKDDKGAGIPLGMVGVLRSVNRSPVVEVAASDEDDCGFQ